MLDVSALIPRAPCPRLLVMADHRSLGATRLRPFHVPRIYVATPRHSLQLQAVPSPDLWRVCGCVCVCMCVRVCKWVSTFVRVRARARARVRVRVRARARARARARVSHS